MPAIFVILWHCPRTVSILLIVNFTLLRLSELVGAVINLEQKRINKTRASSKIYTQHQQSIEELLAYRIYLTCVPL